MNLVEKYSEETVNLLKSWLSQMATKGCSKYFEILVDGLRVIHKTDSLSEFDQHISWIKDTTKSMRVLVYNTKNSHRSQVFEYRTGNYVEGLSDKLYPTRKRRLNEDEINVRVEQVVEERKREQAFIDLQTQNQTLTKRLCDAEDYIRKLELKLESNKEGKEDFNFGSMLKMASVMADKNPALKKQLEDFGISGLVNDDAQVPSQNAEEPVTATFRRKLSPEESNQNYSFGNEKSTETNNDTLTLNVPLGNLNDDQCAKMYDIACFLSTHPPYIGTIHEILKSEESK